MDIENETFVNKLSRKAKDSPFVIIGIGGFFASCGYAIYKYKNKGPLVTTAAFLMQLRVAAQGTFVSCIMLGLTWQVLKDTVFKGEKKEGRSQH